MDALSPWLEPRPPALPLPTMQLVPDSVLAGDRLLETCPATTVPVIRSEDMLVLTLQFVNLDLCRYDKMGPVLTRHDPASDAYIILTFPTQHIGEEAFFEVAEGFSLPDGDPDKVKTGSDPLSIPARRLAAGPSRLVFAVPQGVLIPYTLRGILTTCRHHPLSLSPLSHHPPGAEPPIVDPTWEGDTPPATPVTYIEAPYHLFLSPEDPACVLYSLDPVSHEARDASLPGIIHRRTELWHARMASVEGLKASETVPVRAIWSREYPNTPGEHDTKPFRMSLDAKDRYQLVRLMADYQGLYRKACKQIPQPAQARRLILSALGAWLDLRGQWDQMDDLSVVEWKHQATLGRDHYVRVVYAGYLFPFGHPASLVKITERKFERHFRGEGQPVAFLRQRMYIVVRQPVRDYDDLFGAYPEAADQAARLKFPFAAIRITTTVTPDLDQPGKPTDPGGGSYGQDAFWPRVGGQRFLFHCVAVDRNNPAHVIEFNVPLLFVANDTAFDSTKRDDILNYYQRPTNDSPPPRCLGLGGQKMAFAPGDKGATTLVAQTAVLSAEAPATLLATVQASNLQPFLPTVVQATVMHPAVEHLLANSGGAGSLTISPSGPAGRWDPEQGGAVFARVKSVPLAFPVERAGGVVMPNFSITGLSRSFGPVGGVDDILNGSFDPNKFFDPSARFLGGINLAEIICASNDPDRLPMPRLTQSENADKLLTKLAWLLAGSALKPDSKGIFQPNDTTTLAVQVTISTPLDGSASSMSVTGTLANFAVSFLNVIRVDFAQLAFASLDGKKMDLSAKLSGVSFCGDLAFLSELEQYIPPSGFEDPPSLTVTPQGVQAGYTLAIPDVAAGAFTLSNLRLSAALSLPFDDRAVGVRFGFCEREHPFTLSVMGFAGEGHVGLWLDTETVRQVEVSLGFGGNVSLDIGVASGGVYVMAGFTVTYSDARATFGGYLRCGGGLEVLGLIGISVEFYLVMQYGQGCVWGEATMIVEIEILFFSISVDLTVHREFADPAIPFRDSMSPDDWRQYSAAFA